MAIGWAFDGEAMTKKKFQRLNECAAKLMVEYQVSVGAIFERNRLALLQAKAAVERFSESLKVVTDK